MTPRKMIKKLRWIVLVMICTLFTFIFLFYFSMEGSERKDSSIYFEIFMNAVSIVSALIGWFIVKKQKNRIPGVDKDGNFMSARFFSFSIIKNAALVGGILYCSLGYILSLQPSFLVTFTGLIIYMVFIFPILAP